MLLGVMLGLSTAWTWATTSLLVKTFSNRVGALSLNAFRMVTASILFLALLPFFGGWEAMDRLSVASRLALLFSALAGTAFGDTLYFWSMTRIGASRALPISNIYPLFTWALAAPFLGEPLTWRALLGTGIILVGLYLLAPPSEPVVEAGTGLNRAGVMAAIGAAVLWALGTAAMKFGLQDGVNVVAVNAFRMPLSALILVGIVHWREGFKAWKPYDRRTLPSLVALALYSTGLGGVLWVLAVEYAGAARAALLNTTSPLVGMPLAVVFLHERVTPRIALGALCSVIGIAMIL
jgi:DME family drug/metabolite transporter